MCALAGGIQAIISAKTCDKVYALELDPLACKIAKINTILNDVQEKVEIINPRSIYKFRF